MNVFLGIHTLQRSWSNISIFYKDHGAIYPSSTKIMVQYPSSTKIWVQDPYSRNIMVQDPFTAKTGVQNTYSR